MLRTFMFVLFLYKLVRSVRV